MLRELAQAIDDLAQTGRLSPESRENVDFLITGEEPVSDEYVEAKQSPAKATGGSKK